uniref:Uncharacterized protein n=1 Tax=viral metagenome TaxID=1070528 RepID=A0A2V0R960_9ZZZZ
MDRFYASGPDVDVLAESNTVDEGPDVRTDLGIGSSTDAGQTDVEPEGTTDNRGESDTPPKLGGGSPDEGTSITSDHAQVTTGGTDVVETPDERTESESEQSGREQIYPGFHFAPSQHSRGNQLY